MGIWGRGQGVSCLALPWGPSCPGLNRGGPLVWHEPSLLCFLKALHLLNVCALFMADLSPLWSPSSGFYFYFFLFPIPTHALIAHWPPETPTSIREGTSWNVPPREHQRSNCPGGMGLMASELLQPELCMPMSWGYRQIVCAHECTLNMCLTRGFDQGWAEIHQQASCHFRFMVCTIKTGRVLFFFFLLKSTRVSNLFRAWWSGVEVLCPHCFFFLLCLIALLFSSGNRVFR